MSEIADGSTPVERLSSELRWALKDCGFSEDEAESIIVAAIGGNPRPKFPYEVKWNGPDFPEPGPLSHKTWP